MTRRICTSFVGTSKTLEGSVSEAVLQVAGRTAQKVCVCCCNSGDPRGFMGHIKPVYSLFGVRKTLDPTLLLKKQLSLFCLFAHSLIYSFLLEIFIVNLQVPGTVLGAWTHGFFPCILRA